MIYLILVRNHKLLIINHISEELLWDIRAPNKS